jgi:uncharacterized membrane protein
MKLLAERHLALTDGLRPLAGNVPDRIAARIAELQQRVAAKTEVTVESLVRELEDVRKRATESKQYSAAVSALKEIGILLGYVDLGQIDLIDTRAPVTADRGRVRQEV